jgi:hypothetical protein
LCDARWVRYELDPKGGGDKKSARVVEDFYIDVVYKLSPSCQSRSPRNMARTTQKGEGNLTTVTPAPAWMDHGGRGNCRNDNEHYCNK